MGKILVIDSGVGGLSTLCKIRAILPDEEYIYFADRDFMPYGNKSVELIKHRMKTICKWFFFHESIKAVVIACNTATACGIEYLRQQFSSPTIFIGVEPAIKPAINELKQKNVLVLVTASTAKQNKFLELVNSSKQQLSANEPIHDNHNDKTGKKIIVAPMTNLACLIENNIHNMQKIIPQIQKILVPYKHQNIESVVLGCTHYCFIKNIIADFFNAKIYDGNIGVAMRLYNLLNDKGPIQRKSSGGVAFLEGNKAHFIQPNPQM